MRKITSLHSVCNLLGNFILSLKFCYDSGLLFDTVVILFYAIVL